MKEPLSQHPEAHQYPCNLHSTKNVIVKRARTAVQGDWNSLACQKLTRIYDFCKRELVAILVKEAE